MKIYRVVVRGQFEDLSDSQAAALREAQAAHDYLLSAFTAEGTFTYDDKLVAFNLRYEVRQNDEQAQGYGPDELEELVALQSVERAGAWLRENGHPYKRLKASVTDMASMWKP